MSVGVITLVVWLVLVFLSVTEGIERGWLEKLTALNAPIRITPTEAYYSSYYYQVDGISDGSQYTSKSIGEKRDAVVSDPYVADTDSEIPASWPQADRHADGSLKDPVKGLFHILEKSKQTITFSDYEISGAMLRLQLQRAGSQNNLTQVAYLASFTQENPKIGQLLLSPSLRDLNHLLTQSIREGNALQQQAILDNIALKEVKTTLNYWKVPNALLPENAKLHAQAYFKGEQITHLVLNKEADGQLHKHNGELIFRQGEKICKLDPLIPLLINQAVHFQVKSVDGNLNVATQLQGNLLQGNLPWDGLEIAQAEIYPEKHASSPPWLHSENHHFQLSEDAIVLAKSFQENGVLVGDRGYLSYTANTASSFQEQRQPVYVAGFYDPGIMSIGNKVILVSPAITRTINANSNSYHLDRLIANGVNVWFEDLDQVDAIKLEIQNALAQQGLAPYWKITPFYEYDFAKDLLQQFQSDKYLFTLVGLIILIVACSNIISLLVLLVNDKKREIGILQALGASQRSIAAIFGICGVTMGIISSLIGTLAALITLHNIDLVVTMLSFLQGHEAFSTAFYGKSLPNELSSSAVLFILIVTPIISLCAGLVPAIKACRLRPSVILRSE